jgi:hypothetical protein
MSNELAWKRVKEDGQNHYVSGSFRIEPVIDPYWRWILGGVSGLTKNTFRTLKDAKEHAQQRRERREYNP